MVLTSLLTPSFCFKCSYLLCSTHFSSNCWPAGSFPYQREIFTLISLYLLCSPLESWRHARALPLPPPLAGDTLWYQCSPSVWLRLYFRTMILCTLSLLCNLRALPGLYVQTTSSNLHCYSYIFSVFRFKRRTATAVRHRENNEIYFILPLQNLWSRSCCHELKLSRWVNVITTASNNLSLIHI